MKFTRLSLVLLATSVLVSGTAMAQTQTIYDSVASGLVNTGEGSNDPTLATWYGPHNVSGGGTYTQTFNSTSNAPSWANGQTANFGDIVGDNNFDIQSLMITRTATSITFSEQTAYNNIDGSGARYADIFIDTARPQTPDSWNYAIALGSNLTRDGSVPGDLDAGGNGTTAGLYALTSPNDYLTSDQVWANEPGYGIGGLIQPCNTANSPTNNNSCTGAAAGWNNDAVAPATLLNPNGNETLLSDPVTTSVSAPNSAGYITLSATINITDAADWAIFNNAFDVLAASADCANDAIWGTVQATEVPAPGALVLLGFGLFGLGGLRRKAAKAV